jgi:hypothetical protein
MTIVLACAIRALSSIQTGIPAAASGSIPLARPQGAVRSAINRTSTPRSSARISAPTIPGADCQPVSADEDLTLGVVNCADGETGAVVLRGEADRDSGIRCQESGGRSEQ